MKKIKINKYYNQFYKNIQPIKSNQFNINRNNNTNFSSNKKHKNISITSSMKKILFYQIMKTI